ncbi:FAD-binding oxidoreductase [Nocardioides limicola]|uniref:FAD-binding oxidoreductase n=1 Tax=Nocardioides limicola TaxID=2803368 RepID=UPI00193AECD2|nr:FAD-binding oxidoreductase [Nocardioides sp. DJM-14]
MSDDVLTAAIEGRVHYPGEAGYDAAKGCWNVLWVHQPAVVVEAASVNDVVVALSHARRNGLKVAVQSTGHGVTVPADAETMLLVVAGLASVEIDAGNQVARIGGGATWAPVLAQAQRHGLAPLLGSAPHVGAVGYTLGGGFGWLARRYGLAVDHVRSLRVVRADGWVVTASRSSHPELFWALCGGGGGSLGVVVEMEIGLVPVGEVYAGNLFYPIEDAAAVFDFYREWSERQSADFTSAFTLMNFPPLEMVPAPIRGRSFALLRGCHSGDGADGKAAVDEWRAWREPALDMFGPMPYAECGEISADPVDPVPAIASGRWLTHLDDDVLAAMLEAVTGGPGPSPLLMAETRHAGGAVTGPVPSACFEARGADRMLELIALVMAPEAGVEAERRISATWQRLAGHLPSLSGYLNFAEGAERQTVAATAYTSDTRHRLAAVKASVDPLGMFSNGVGHG